MTTFKTDRDGNLTIFGRPLLAETRSAASSQADGAAQIERGAEMTNSAPHDGQRPPLSEEKACERHETMEHLPRGASAAAPSDSDNTKGPADARNSTVPVPGYAPPRALRFRNDDDRHLYFVLNPSTGRIKIGIAGSVEGRIRVMEGGAGTALELLAARRHMAPFEEHVHEALASSRYFGEWFRWTPELEDLICAVRDASTDDTAWAYLLEFIAHAEDQRRFPSATNRVDATPIDRTETPLSRIRNAMTIIEMGRVLLGSGGSRFQLSSSEINDVWRHLFAARNELEREARDRAEILHRVTVPVPGATTFHLAGDHPLMVELLEMERTVSELAEGPSGLVDREVSR